MSVSKLMKRPHLLFDRSMKIIHYPVWILTGTEYHSGDKLGIIFAGSEENKNFIAKLAFVDQHEETFAGEKFFWEISNIAERNKGHCSILVFHARNLLLRFIKKKGDYHIPSLIIGEVDVPLTANNKSAKDDLRKIRKNNLSYEVTTDISQLHNFYQTMYLPYITQKHASRVILDDYQLMVEKVKTGNCKLLLIREQNDFIAGALLVLGEKIPRLWSIGVRDGNKNYMKMGALAATYYFASLYLHEQDHTKMNLGGSRPFFKNGVLQFKKKWGLRITGISKYGFVLRQLFPSKSLDGFFLQNPFIFIDTGSLAGMVFTEEEIPLPIERLGDLYRDYYIQGISKFILCKCGDGDSVLLEIFPQQ